MPEGLTLPSKFPCFPAPLRRFEDHAAYRDRPSHIKLLCVGAVPMGKISESLTMMLLTSSRMMNAARDRRRQRSTNAARALSCAAVSNSNRSTLQDHTPVRPSHEVCVISCQSSFLCEVQSAITLIAGRCGSGHDRMHCWAR